MKIELYGLGRPTRTTRVAWALEEAGVDYDLHAIDPRTDDFLAINPMGKVPALVVDGQVLTESGACCFWVADQFPDAGLAPAAGTWERAQTDRWAQFVLTELEQPLWLKAKHSFALPKDVRVPEVKPAAAWEFARATQVLEKAVEGRTHLVGDRFTVADLLATHTVIWAQHSKFAVPPAVMAYAAQHMMRPALQRAMTRETASR